jgi:hypothetical protein
VATYGKIVLIFAFVVAFIQITYAQRYVVNAYGDGTFPRPVKTVFVNLETKAIIREVITGQEGEILNGRPLPITRGDRTFLISAIMEECFCKNSNPGGKRLRINIFDSASGDLVNSSADSDLSLYTFIGLPGNLVFVEGETIARPRQIVRGDYALSPDYRLALLRPRAEGDDPHLFGPLGPFSYLEPVDVSNNLYLGLVNYMQYIVRTDARRAHMIDTLRLNTANLLANPVLADSISDRSHILAVKDSLLYDFNLNAEFYGDVLRRTPEMGRIAPHLRLYRLADFAPLDSILVTDYPPGDYPSGEFATADVVGPYIVHYFFSGEGLTRYAPAMLFIFDTRTNEATWLRVGWR